MHGEDKQLIVWSIIFCTAGLVALIAADILHAAGVSPLHVVVVGLSGAAVIGMTVAAETLFDRKQRPKP
jgi:hypothetical protein